MFCKRDDLVAQFDYDWPNVSGNPFLIIITAAVASETRDALVESASIFSAAIEGQLEATQSDPVPVDFAQRTAAYAKAKIASYDALPAAVPEPADVASGRKPRPPEVDQFAKAFQIGF